MKKIFVIFFFCVSLMLDIDVNAESSKNNNKQQVQVMQRTFAMIKPSGMHKTNEIKNIIAQYGLIVLKSKKIKITSKQIDRLYAMHKDKPFYNDLKSSLENQEVEVMVLYGNHAVDNYRKAVKEIRKKYAKNKTENAVHGSDSWKLAHDEICMFFTCGR